MKQIPILSGKAMIVELPEGAPTPDVINTGQSHLSWLDIDINLPDINLPPGNWRIIGMLSEVTEEQLDGIVESDTFMGGGVTIHKNYNQGGWLPTRTMSLDSAILAEGYIFENPYTGVGIKTAYSEYRRNEYQSRVLDRTRCLLLGREDG